MEKTDKLLSMLGLCRKAGKLVHGFEAVADSMKKREAQLVLTAHNLSPKSVKEIAFIAGREQTEVMGIPVTIDEIAQKTGKRAGILAVTDKGFAEAVKRDCIHVKEEDEYGREISGT